MTQSSDEYLKQYINEKDKSNVNVNENDLNDKKHDLGSVKELEHLEIGVENLPCSKFYPAGTTFWVRAAKVSEIQAYSMIDDTNIYDVYEKVNTLISSCVFIKDPSGKSKPYINIIDGDRWYLLFVIRELTFRDGKDLYTEVDGFKIPLKRQYFTFFEMDEKLKKYYDNTTGQFQFNTKQGEINMAPPTLGLQKSFTDYMVKEVQSKKKLNQSFLKIIPYTMPGRNSITEEGIKKKLEDFENMEEKLFQFLNQAVDKMTFGISGVKAIDEKSGQEVHSDEIFPDGFSGLFIQHDAFDDFLE